MADAIEDIYTKLTTKDLVADDLGEFLRVLKALADRSLLVQDELYGWDQSIQFVLEDEEDFYVAAKDILSSTPQLVIEPGRIDSPTASVTTDADTLTGVLCGRIARRSISPGKWVQKGNGIAVLMMHVIVTIAVQELQVANGGTTVIRAV